jgi:YgiT-type zinc finger domain-containing protein
MDSEAIAMNETRCQICGGADFDVRRVEYIYRRRGNYLVVRDVPCEVCLRCGERYYAGATLLQIEQRFKAIYEQHARPQYALQVPVEVYA